MGGATKLILSYHADCSDLTLIPLIPELAVMISIVPTLRHLTLEVFKDSFISYQSSDLATLPAEFVQDLVDHGIQLRKIALGFPEYAVSNDFWDVNEPWRKQIEILASLPNLRALRVLNWPLGPVNLLQLGHSTTHDRVEHEVTWRRYAAQFAKFATRAVRCVHAVRKREGFNPLRVLCIGNRSSAVEVAAEDGQHEFPGQVVCYVLAMQSSLGEGEALFAREVSSSDVCYDDQNYRSVTYV